MGIDNQGDSVEVAIRSRTAYARVHGRGTFKVGPALKEFGMAAMDRGCDKILVEMEACTGMDSTFMGTLAGLAAQLGKTGGVLKLLHANDKNKFLIKMLGLRELVRVDDEVTEEDRMPSVTESLREETAKRQLTEAMISAHEVLVDVAPENVVKFKDVLSFLREDLKVSTKAQEQPAP